MLISMWSVHRHVYVHVTYASICIQIDVYIDVCIYILEEEPVTSFLGNQQYILLLITLHVS